MFIPTDITTSTPSTWSPLPWCCPWAACKYTFWSKIKKELSIFSRKIKICLKLGLKICKPVCYIPISSLWSTVYILFCLTSLIMITKLNDKNVVLSRNSQNWRFLENCHSWSLYVLLFDRKYNQAEELKYHLKSVMIYCNRKIVSKF